jgi:hypothetical protein
LRSIQHTSERHRIYVFPIIRERHIGLTEANGVLALGNTIINLEILLGNALREVENRNETRRTSD